MFTNIYNLYLDIFYGYLEIKCANPNCTRTFKISRNSYTNTEYSCNMGCALSAFNKVHNLESP